MQQVGSAAESARGALSGLMGPLAGLASVGGLTMAVRGMIQMQSSAEGTRQAIAGALNAFGAATSFDDAMQQGADVMQIINREAAALPGSAEDYVQVFRTALPGAMSAGFQSLSAVAHFTDQMTAIASANQEDAQQAGMDMSRMFQGRAGMEVRLWTTLQPLIGKTAEEFNRMSAPQRAQAMQHAIDRYRGTLQHMGDTWDAIYGTTSQYATQITRGATAPIFESMKGALSHLNEWIGRNQDRLTDLGASISRNLVDVFDPIDGRLAGIAHRLDIMGRLSRAAGFIGSHGGMFARLAGGAALGPLGGILAGGAMGLVRNHGDVLQNAGSELAAMFGRMTAILEPLTRVGDSISNLFGNTLAAALPGVVSGIVQLGDGITSAVSIVSGPFSNAIDTVSTLFAGPLGSAIGDVASTLGGLLKDGLVEVATDLGELAHYLTNAVLTLDSWAQSLSNWMVRNGFGVTATGGGSFHEFMSDLGDVARSVGHHLADPYGVRDMERRRNQQVADAVGEVRVSLIAQGRLHVQTAQATAQAATHAQDSLDSLGHSASGWGSEFSQAAAEAARNRRLHGNAHATPHARGGAHTHNDFRHSRFEITQRFAEGFDPDRIAIGFVHYIERTADRRLSGSLEPMHAVR
jgi:hypothetical protein